ncbi:MAG: DUF6115 domain-containing protein [Catonella sp.]
MDTIIILCIIAGAAMIGASFIIKEGLGIDSQEKEKIAEEIRSKVLSVESLKKVMDKVEKEFTERLSDVAEDKMTSSTDYMSELTNNKMFAINEMCGQLIEKIEQNHKEVIFLYDMLNEKSDNLKDFSAKVEGLRKELENEEKRIKALGHDLDDKIVKVKEVRQTVITRPVADVPSKTVPKKNTTKEESVKTPAQEVEIQTEDIPTQAEALVKLQKTQELVAKPEPVVKEAMPEKEPAKITETASVVSDRSEEEIKEMSELSTNDRILLMKEEGKSVIEISKALGMGQGEVQLILGLYGK